MKLAFSYYAVFFSLFVAPDPSSFASDVPSEHPCPLDAITSHSPHLASTLHDAIHKWQIIEKHGTGNGILNHPAFRWAGRETGIRMGDLVRVGKGTDHLEISKNDFERYGVADRAVNLFESKFPPSFLDRSGRALKLWDHGIASKVRTLITETKLSEKEILEGCKLSDSLSLSPDYRSEVLTTLRWLGPSQLVYMWKSPRVSEKRNSAGWFNRQILHGIKAAELSFLRSQGPPGTLDVMKPTIAGPLNAVAELSGLDPKDQKLLANLSRSPAFQWAIESVIQLLAQDHSIARMTPIKSGVYPNDLIAHRVLSLIEYTFSPRLLTDPEAAKQVEDMALLNARDLKQAVHLSEFLKHNAQVRSALEKKMDELGPVWFQKFADVNGSRRNSHPRSYLYQFHGTPLGVKIYVATQLLPALPIALPVVGLVFSGIALARSAKVKGLGRNEPSHYQIENADKHPSLPRPIISLPRVANSIDLALPSRYRRLGVEPDHEVTESKARELALRWSDEVLSRMTSIASRSIWGGVSRDIDDLLAIESGDNTKYSALQTKLSAIGKGLRDVAEDLGLLHEDSIPILSMLSKFGLDQKQLALTNLSETLPETISQISGLAAHLEKLSNRDPKTKFDDNLRSDLTHLQEIMPWEAE